MFIFTYINFIFGLAFVLSSTNDRVGCCDKSTTISVVARLQSNKRRAKSTIHEMIHKQKKLRKTKKSNNSSTTVPDASSFFGTESETESDKEQKEHKFVDVLQGFSDSGTELHDSYLKWENKTGDRKPGASARLLKFP